MERTLKLDKANKELQINTTIKKTGNASSRSKSAALSKKATKKKDEKAQTSSEQNPKPTKNGSAKTLSGVKRMLAESSDKKAVVATSSSRDSKQKRPIKAIQKVVKSLKKRTAKQNAKQVQNLSPSNA